MAAGLGLFWWHMRQKLSVQAGAKRAKALMATTFKGGRLDTNDDSATFSSDSLIATNACLPHDKDEIRVIIIVAGHDGNRAQRTMEELRDGMQSGGPFE